jgi:hypothetical protein
VRTEKFKSTERREPSQLWMRRPHRFTGCWCGRARR